MSQENLDTHIDDIINSISAKSDNEVSREEIKKELDRFMEYGVPIEQAKITLIKKFGGDVSFSTSSNERKLISDLEPNERGVKLLGRVIAVNPKEITVRGENRKIFYGILGDESGTIPFTAWNEVNFEKGDVIEISNAYTREWQGSAQLNFGDRVHIEKTDKNKLPESAFKPRELKVTDLKSGIGSVDVSVRILEINEREANINGEKRNIFSGTIADETGKAQFTSWHDFKLKEGDVVRITGGYVKSWKGIPQLTFDDKATIKKLDKSKIPKTDLKINKMPIFALVEKRGALDVEVQGSIIDIRPGSGVIQRCPTCNRSLFNGECSIHGKVSGKPDLRIKLVIDDGTGAVSSVLNKDLSEKLIGMNLEECKKLDETELMDKIIKKIFTQNIIIQGNALGDEYGTSIIAKNVETVEINLEEEAEKIMNSLEDLL